MCKIKEYTGSDYEVVRILVKIELNDNSDDLKLDVSKKLSSLADDITIYHTEPMVGAIISIHSLLCMSNFSNKECVSLVIKELKKYLKYSKKITITEQRFPLEVVLYELN